MANPIIRKTITRKTGPDRHLSLFRSASSAPASPDAAAPEQDPTDINHPEAGSRRPLPDKPAPREARRQPNPHLLNQGWPSFSGLGLGSLVLLLLAVGFYYWIGALMVQRIDDDPAFRPAPINPGERETLAMVAGLIQRETRTHHWVANDPIALPGALLSRMAAYQQGIIATLRHVVESLADRADTAAGTAIPTGAPSETSRTLWDGLWSLRETERVKAAAALRADLRHAADLLASPADAWIMDLTTSFGRQPSTEMLYGQAGDLLRDINRRMADGTASWPIPPSGSRTVPDCISLDLDAILADVDARLSSPPHTGPDALPAHRFYYRIKGQVYAMALVLGAWSRDTPQALTSPESAAALTQAETLLTHAGTLRPWIVTMGSLDGLLIPNHLVAQGYLLHQARDALATLRDSMAHPSDSALANAAPPRQP